MKSAIRMCLLAHASLVVGPLWHGGGCVARKATLNAGIRGVKDVRPEDWYDHFVIGRVRPQRRPMTGPPHRHPLEELRPTSTVNAPLFPNGPWNRSRR